MIDIGAKFTLAAGVTGQGALDRLNRSVGDVNDGVGRLPKLAAMATAGLTAIAGALSVGVLASWVTNTADAADELARLSDQTGISVEKLSAWGNVARRNGQDVNDLAELTTEMSLRLAEIDKDSEGAGLALKQLGLSYKDLAALPADEAFEAIARAVAGTEDSGRKTALVMAALGDEAQKYVTTLNTIGAAGEMEASITRQQAMAAREYKDALSGLSTAGQEWSQSVASGILPALSEAARALDDVMSGTDGLTAEARKLARDGTITDWARAGVTALTYLVDAGIYTYKVLASIGKTAAAAAVQVVEAMTGIGDVAGRVLAGDFSGAVSAAGAAITRVKTAGQAWAEDLEVTWSERTLGAKIRDRIGDIQAYSKATKDAAKPPKTSVKDKTLVKADDSAAKAAAAAKKKADADAERENARALAEYEKLITSIRAKTEAEAAEINGTAAATEAQKMALEVMTQIRDGRLKLTDAQKGNVSAYLEELLTTERLLAAKRQQIEIDAQAIEATQGVRDTMRSRTEALQEQIKATRLEGEEIGLSAKALLALRDARELDKAAALERRAEITASLEDGAAMAAIYRDQAAAIRELVQTQSNNRAGAESARKDPMAGARAGLDAYKEQLSSTAADVQSAVGAVAGGLEDAMLGAFNGSADGAKKLFQTIKAEALKLLVIKPILQQLTGSGGGNVLGALASAASTMFGGAGNAGYGDYSAKGMAAAFGGQKFAKGGVFDKTTPIRFAQGGKLQNGIMGEAGPEAIMPLERGPSGKLGVRASGGGGAVSVTYAPTINIDSRSDRAQIMQDVAALNRRGQEEIMQTLKERGVA